jgi:thioredoxin reductase (NADPH)
MTTDPALVDVIIIGGGPAGISALNWCRELNLDALLIEKDRLLGGQLLWTYNAIDNYPGIRAAHGREFCRKLLGSSNVTECVITDVGIAGSDLASGSVILADGGEFRGRFIIIATGVRRRKLHVPGEDALLGKGVLTSGSLSRDEVVGKTVAIIGGGDAALENALILAGSARRVIIVHRRDKFSARKEFLDNACDNPGIALLPWHRPVEIVGNDSVTGIRLIDLRTGDHKLINIDAVLIRIGVAPNTEAFRGQLDLDDNGYVITDRYLLTSRERVFAIGDVSNPAAPTISGAIGDGATAVKNIVRLKNAGC